MYSFEPNEEQQMLIDAVGKYAENDLRPAAHDAEESRELPKKLVSKGWELGLLQASIPESYGGFGDRSAVTGALAVEEMAFGDLAGARDHPHAVVGVGHDRRMVGIGGQQAVELALSIAAAPSKERLVR